MKPEQKKDDRAERLAAALRENLKRRKAQARTLEKKTNPSTEEKDGRLSRPPQPSRSPSR